jgi:hypothetical protein
MAVSQDGLIAAHDCDGIRLARDAQLVPGLGGDERRQRSNRRK